MHYSKIWELVFERCMYILVERQYNYFRQGESQSKVTATDNVIQTLKGRGVKTVTLSVVQIW